MKLLDNRAKQHNENQTKRDMAVCQNINKKFFK